MSHCTLVDISPYEYGFYPILEPLAGTTYLKVFLQNLVTAGLQGRRIYLTVSGDEALPAVKAAAADFAGQVEIVSPTGSRKTLPITSRVFTLIRDTMKQMVDTCPDIQQVYFYAFNTVLFDREMTCRLISETETHHYDFSCYSYNHIEHMFAPIIISTKLIRDFLASEHADNPKYYSPTTFFAVELKNKYNTQIELTHPHPFLDIPYDISRRICLRSFSAHRVMLDHLNRCRSIAPTLDIGWKACEQAFSYPDRFAIEIGFDGSGTNPFYPKVDNQRPRWVSVDSVQSLLRSLRNFPGNLSIDLIGSIDPLLHPELQIILGLLHDFKLGRLRSAMHANCPTELTVYTPGHGLTDAVADALFANTVDNLLLNAFTGAGDQPEWPAVKQNLVNYLNKKYRRMEENNTWYKVKPETGIYMILAQHTEKNVQPFLNEWAKTRNYFIPNKNYTDDELKLAWERFYKDTKFPLEHAVIYLHNSYCGRLENLSVSDFTPLKRFPCRKLINGCVLLTDGRITVCEQDVEGAFAFTNADFDLMNDFISNQRYQQWFANQRAGVFNDPVICSTCDQYFIPVC